MGFVISRHSTKYPDSDQKPDLSVAQYVGQKDGASVDSAKRYAVLRVKSGLTTWGGPAI
jgi:hypothetical protein